MTASDFGTIISALVAVAALGYSYLQSYLQTGIKKYELKRDYVSHMLEWYSCTVRILIDLKHLLKNNPEQFHKTKHELLSKLSAQIEIGRFYFPNIDKGDGFGEEKPKAYQGYRNVALEFLIDGYDICLKSKPERYLDHFELIQREFTSVVYEIIDPHEVIRETKILADKYYLKYWSIEEYLAENPERLDIYLNWYEE